MKLLLSQKFVTLSASILMGVTPLANTTTAFASTSNVISTKTSTVTVSKKTYLLNQNGKKLPVVLAKGEKPMAKYIIKITERTTQFKLEMMKSILSHKRSLPLLN